jgi:hypothetical protein
MNAGVLEAVERPEVKEVPEPHCSLSFGCQLPGGYAEYLVVSELGI